jgi:hypothetical protein
MACAECERLDKVEIECVRRVDTAQSHLHSFFPEPPFGEAAANQLRSYEHAAEKSRASLDNAKRERTVHRETHAMTLSR